MSIQTVLTMLAVAVAVGGLVGWMIGDAHGRDVQWLDDYFTAQAKDRERRDERGRWKRRAQP